MRQAKLKRLLAEKYFLLELELHWLDCMSSNKLMGSYEFLKAELAKAPQVELPDPLVNGDDLIRHGLQPGPEFKVMLETAMDAQLEGRIRDKKEALAFLKEKFQLPGGV